MTTDSKATIVRKCGKQSKKQQFPANVNDQYVLSMLKNMMA
ncbi:hypothetical protein yaldo0001_40170 [Yersinia aldovae ATCC 35236]|nr:hypothetical protein yaldo0001_40170 [Yersinia aldovae ATCC 35236]